MASMTVQTERTEHEVFLIELDSNHNLLNTVKDQAAKMR